MSLPTVRMTIQGLFQDATPFFGIARFRLSRTAMAEGNLVSPQNWQDVEFQSDGVAVADLIPNSLLGAGTYYEYQLIKLTTGVYISERYCKQHCILKGVIVVPDHDCNFADLVALPAMGDVTVEVETLEPGASATAEFSPQEALLTFGIPKGERGEQGEKGEQGEPGASVVQEAVITDDGRLVLTVV